MSEDNQRIPASCQRSAGVPTSLLSQRRRPTIRISTLCKLGTRQHIQELKIWTLLSRFLLSVDGELCHGNRPVFRSPRLSNQVRRHPPQQLW
jgi:hypothetical protein